MAPAVVIAQSRNQGTGTTQQEEAGEDHVKTRPVKLVYGLPASMGEAIREKISHFTFEFAAEEVRKIWKCCREVGNPAEFTEEEMEAFHRSVAIKFVHRSSRPFDISLQELWPAHMPNNGRQS